MEQLIDRLITLGVVLGFWGICYIVRLFAGFKNVRKQLKKWNWVQFGDGLLDRLGWLIATAGAVVACEMLKWLMPLIGITLSDEITLLLDTGSVIAIPFAAGIKDLVMGIRSIQKSAGWENNVKYIGAEFTGDIDYTQIANNTKQTVKEIADLLTPTHTSNDNQTDDTAEPDSKAIEVGQGAGNNPLSRRLPDGDNCNGKGWQCSKYSWYLASGEVMNYAPHPDYGPCNGNVMVNYLINKLGWVRCNKQNGAIFSYNSGQYGHTGMVVDAANNIVNDANWILLKVNTHYLNLEAVGAIYCCPKNMVQNETDNTNQTKKTDQEIADEVIAGKWGTKDTNPTRKEQLESAGYNYESIQAIVNAKMAPKTDPEPAPKRNKITEGSVVIPTKLVDYTGHKVVQHDPSYTVTQLRGDRAVLSARGAVWCAMSVKNLKLA